MRIPRMLSRSLVGVAAIGVGLMAQHVAAGASDGQEYRKSEDDVRVEAALKERLPKTQVSRVDCARVDGVCEVTAGSQLFYVDRTGRYLMIGRVYDMQTRQDLTAVRLLEVNPDLLIGGAAGSRREAAETAPRRGMNAPSPGAPRTLSLASLPEAGGIVWGNPSGETVTVFSDFSCGYCRALSGVLEQMNVRVVERPISILGSRAVAEKVFCASDRRRAVRQAYAGETITNTRNCDASALDANEKFARDNGIAGTPVIVRSDGAVIEGFRPREALVAWLKGVKS